MQFPTIVSQQRTEPPAWAVLQRQLFRAIDAAAPIFLEKYTRPGGALIWQEEYPGDGVWADDLYEAFFNWPLYYSMGGSRYTGVKAVEEWNAVTRQIEHDYGRAHREFISDDDWFHNSENYIYFYALGLADPTNNEMLRRARRFAGFYMGEDPQVPNYDPQQRIIRSPFSGSKGPLFHARYADVQYNLEYGHTTLGPDFPLPEKWYEDDALRRQIHARFDEVVMHSDVPVNLGVVVLVTNAFLYTGEDKYRNWVVEYVDAWLGRIEANGGIIPDNIGPNGLIGEQRQGQWWGGFYGWTGTYSHQMMGCAMLIAAECAQLVTGQEGYLNLIRSQLDVLMGQAKRQDGLLVVPHKYTDQGWCQYGPMHNYLPIHLWAASQQEGDWQRLEQLRQGDEAGWGAVGQRGPRSLDDRAWTRYLAGDCPDYPEQIMQANYREVCRRLELVMEDRQDFTKMDVHHWQQVNPVVTEGLEHLTTGGPQTIYWGGLAQGRVRYFDPDQQRPGLPQDVAALVTGLGPESVSLSLVNLSVAAARTVVVGAGGFGEHRFTQIQGDEPVPIDNPYLQVDLKPGSQIDLELGMRRFCQTPSYAFPWHGDGIPFR
ncbi:MAG: hypothetical protein GKR89_17390 [Candidatus Latescibacteria bacterium]|nr:hypothetical protein [Candidatus Latescibacterota bacterium]